MKQTVIFISLYQIIAAIAFGPSIRQSYPMYSNIKLHAMEPNASIKGRRDVISDIPASLLFGTILSTPLRAQSYIKPIFISSVKDIAHYIILNCNQSYLRSVRLSKYNFLYRGEDIKSRSSKHYKRSTMIFDIINDPSDLLDDRTYESKEAVKYFQQLERILSASGSDVKPSNGHIGTTCPKEASKWGTAVSIWPLGEDGVNFAWLKEGGIFWPLPNDKAVHDREVVFGKNSGLEKALEGDAWEIMFRADNGFLAVPAELDDELKDALNQI